MIIFYMQTETLAKFGETCTMATIQDTGTVRAVIALINDFLNFKKTTD